MANKVTIQQRKMKSASSNRALWDILYGIFVTNDSITAEAAEVYHVDTKRIEGQLVYLQTCLRILREIDGRSLEQPLTQFAAARALHMAIECVTEIGNALIDGFIMRDPGGYEDIVAILEEEGVIAREVANKLKHLVEYRKTLVLHYTKVDRTLLERLIQLAQSLNPFARAVETYLQQELGPDSLVFHA